MKSTFLILGSIFSLANAYGGQSLVLSPGNAFSFTVSNQPPYSLVGSSRLEFRVDGWTRPKGITDLINLPGLEVRFADSSYNAPLLITDWMDTFSPGVGNGLSLQVANMQDMVVRIQRDTVAGTLSAQAWEASAPGQAISATIPIASPGMATLPAGGALGGDNTSASLDYVRWFSALVPPQTSPFNTDHGDLLDLEMEGVLADASAQHLTIIAQSLMAAPIAAAVFGTSPSYVPYASQGPQRVFHAGAPVILDASSSVALNNHSALVYQWTEISGPSQLQWDSTDSVSPTITGLVFGSYLIQLTVTDGSGQRSSNTLKYGSVYTNASDVVIPPQNYVTTVLGPMLRLGANPWPYFDESQQHLADFFGGLQSSDYSDVWNTAQAGTVQVSNGSTAVQGDGTKFRSAFCAGSSSASNGATLIVNYPISGSPGQWGRAPYQVASCQSDTSLTLAQPYVSSDSANDLQFASMDNTSIGTWIGGSTNANYYDNVMAFYSLYYRSGLDDYLQFARTLADRWYTMPWFDGGRATLRGSTALFPRLQSLTGIVLRALDGRPDYWEGIRLYANWDYGFVHHAPGAGYALIDIREQGYATAFLALAALFDPDPSLRSTYRAEVRSVLSDVWVPSVQSGGNWVNASYGFASWNGSPGSVAVTHGSTTVTGSGTDWQPGWFTGNAFWTADPNGITHGDAAAYTATLISPTTLTLSTPYQGPTAAGRGWEANDLVGVGTQPYMLGIAGRGLWYAHVATGDSRIPGLLTGMTHWLSTEGYRADARGLWYGRIFPNCEPISSSNLTCSGGSVEQSRFLAGEIVGAVSATYFLTGDTAVSSFGDDIYGAMFGGPAGGLAADSVYVNDIANGGWAIETKLSKDFGFFFGFGGGASWPAVRLGPKALPLADSCQVSLTSSQGQMVALGGSAQVTITTDDGCLWSASSDVPWISITAGVGGSGTGAVTYSVSVNTGSSERTGTINIAGESLPVHQSGNGCDPSSQASPSGFTTAGFTHATGNAQASSANCLGKR